MKKLEVYGRSDIHCPYCEEAKSVLDKREIQYTYIDVSTDDDGFKKLKSLGLSTVPQLF